MEAHPRTRHLSVSEEDTAKFKLTHKDTTSKKDTPHITAVNLYYCSSEALSFQDSDRIFINTAPKEHAPHCSVEGFGAGNHYPARRWHQGQLFD